LDYRLKSSRCEIKPNKVTDYKIPHTSTNQYAIQNTITIEKIDFLRKNQNTIRKFYTKYS